MNPIRTFADDDEPRISSRALARKLGMSHEEVLALIEQHRDELERLGPVIRIPIPKGEDR